MKKHGSTPIRKFIPAFGPNGALPQGVHFATWSQFKIRFGTNPHRFVLLGGLARALRSLKKAFCPLVYIDGSFVTAKPKPGDYDVCYETIGVRTHLLPTEFKILSSGAGIKQKARYRGEFYPAMKEADGGNTFLNFFQKDRDGNPKGIVALFLRDFP